MSPAARMHEIQLIKKLAEFGGVNRQMKWDHFLLEKPVSFSTDYEIQNYKKV